jgi:hypothetical protein
MKKKKKKKSAKDLKVYKWSGGKGARISHLALSGGEIAQLLSDLRIISFRILKLTLFFFFKIPPSQTLRKLFQLLSRVYKQIYESR